MFFAIFGCFFLINLTLAVIWGNFAASHQSAEIATDAEAIMKRQRELQLDDEVCTLSLHCAVSAPVLVHHAIL